ncbi:MAG TPA: hypothetical protein PKI93_03110 [Alphaproteobacteria bacterium]|nr:hypothetical protein [Alphaproteobacteria bacterium]HNS44133.1 hypothetical protein [Alphaproteobacteria bacterium]
MAVIDLDDDLDILGEARKAKDGDKYVIPPDAPVLPSIISNGRDAELVVDVDSRAVLIFDKPLPEPIEWVEYDIDLSILTFVTYEGKVQGLGMKVHKPFRRYLGRSEQILLVHLGEDDKVKEFYPAKLVVRHIGL